MPEDGELAFSLYELRKVLGWSDDSGGAYREIRDALLRIQLTGVQSTNAYYSAADEQLISDSFNVWSVHFAQRRKRRGGAGPGGAASRATADRHVLRFHPIFIRNYEAQYLKGLDADFFFSLRLPLSKRLYRLVDLQRAGGLVWRTDLFAVRDQVPLDYPYPSQIKRALQKAHAELEAKGFLSGTEHPGKTGLVYRVSPSFARRQKALELAGTPQEMFAIERLMREGVRGDTARELVVSHGADECLRYADALDSQPGVRNRASFVVSAIRKGYALPEPDPPEPDPRGAQPTLDMPPNTPPMEDPPRPSAKPPIGPHRARIPPRRSCGSWSWPTRRANSTRPPCGSGSPASPRSPATATPSRSASPTPWRRTTSRLASGPPWRPPCGSDSRPPPPSAWWCAATGRHRESGEKSENSIIPNKPPPPLPSLAAPVCVCVRPSHPSIPHAPPTLSA